jgi:hypothetical protein
MARIIPLKRRGVKRRFEKILYAIKNLAFSGLGVPFGPSSVANR